MYLIQAVYVDCDDDDDDDGSDVDGYTVEQKRQNRR